MPDGRMEIDPAVLRQLASQHDQVARDTREWAKPPADWLANFLPTYGKIAFPVYEALEKYYDARQRAGDALAGEHERTRDSLLASAEAYEDADDEFGSQIRQAGGLIDGSPLPVAPLGRQVIRLVRTGRRHRSPRHPVDLRVVRLRLDPTAPRTTTPWALRLASRMGRRRRARLRRPVRSRRQRTPPAAHPTPPARRRRRPGRRAPV